jgi:hypothetical protein
LRLLRVQGIMGLTTTQHELTFFRSQQVPDDHNL